MADDGRVKDFDFVFSGSATSTDVKLGGWRAGAYKIIGTWTAASLAFDHSDDAGATWDHIYDPGPGTPLDIRLTPSSPSANISHRIGDALLAPYDHLRLRSVDSDGNGVAQTCTVRLRCWRDR